ncbi:MAG: tRNA pseudouridine(38-40) synthase TruA [candidate division WOR-3 bacterium]|nr:tRNA pseudouridine(38-40) synthase TruA [candidate division WOR-3 bacterium]MDW8151053.1 tRNA pseudouridine(38-40) synthase TruA [candidate division WOR-3 bacterium]
MVLEFDGTDFYGWQRQGNKRTVQGEIENALSKIIDGDFKVIGCCRTDRGVHALNYVCNVKVKGKLKLDISRLKDAINGLSSSDVFVKSVELVNNSFHARYSAKYKLYCYRILTYPSPLLLRYGFFPKYRIDFGKLKEIERVFIGKRDFRNISAKTEKNGVCNVISSSWLNNEIYYDYFILSDRFLYKMVRSIVGLMILYSIDKLTKEDIINILDSKKEFIPYVVPPQGLTLMKVFY